MESKPRARPDFRSDINGLRAWAVVAVILYHFDVPGFGGGFVGVDVFFVISGFLMTGIVVDGLERGEFSLLAFYLARASRILPALIVVCTVLLMLGWWVLLRLDYTELGLDAVFSLAFLSNIKFWREAGYFDAASHDKWLLHTWSLAVEWQFYLLLPLVLLAMWRWRPGGDPSCW
jgi:peptidoglycan/LPS O-acetylase OafA/YrhL